MHAERTKQMPDVVAHGLTAQLQLARDLLRRRAVTQQSQHLNLPRGEMRGRRLRLVFADIGDLPEHAHDPVVLQERH